MTVGRFIRNTFILTGVMLAVWAFLSGLAAGIFGDITPESQTPVAIVIFFAAETSLIPHGKVLSPSDYTLTLPDLPNLPNLLCPVSGVHSTLYIDPCSG